MYFRSHELILLFIKKNTKDCIIPTLYTNFNQHIKGAFFSLLLYTSTQAKGNR